MCIDLHRRNGGAGSGSLDSLASSGSPASRGSLGSSGSLCTSGYHSTGTSDIPSPLCSSTGTSDIPSPLCSSNDSLNKIPPTPLYRFWISSEANIVIGDGPMPQAIHDRTGKHPVVSTATANITDVTSITECSLALVSPDSPPSQAAVHGSLVAQADARDREAEITQSERPPLSRTHLRPGPRPATTLRSWLRDIRYSIQGYFRPLQIDRAQNAIAKTLKIKADSGHHHPDRTAYYKAAFDHVSSLSDKALETLYSQAEWHIYLEGDGVKTRTIDAIRMAARDARAERQRTPEARTDQEPAHHAGTEPAPAHDAGKKTIVSQV